MSGEQEGDSSDANESEESAAETGGSAGEQPEVLETPTPGPDEEYCTSCGSVIKKEAEICPECGVRHKEAQQATTDKSRLSAALLALFLGGLGIHHFYLGNNKRGVIYLLFFWTLIPAIVAFFEGILYLLKSDEEFARKYAN